LKQKIFLEKNLLEKKINLKVDYRKTIKGLVTIRKNEGNKKVSTSKEVSEERRFVSITVGNKNVAVDLVNAGFATVLRHGQNQERSSDYDQLLKSEQDAISSKKGVHGSKKKAPVHHFNDLTNNDSPGKSQKFLASLKDKKTKAIVERVYSGSRFKLLLPNDSVVIIFSIAGVSSPSVGREGEPKPFSKEALSFSNENLNLRDVEVIIETVNKVGNFIGTLFLNEKDYAIDLLESGFGQLVNSARTLKKF